MWNKEINRALPFTADLREDIRERPHVVENGNPEFLRFRAAPMVDLCFCEEANWETLRYETRRLAKPKQPNMPGYSVVSPKTAQKELGAIRSLNATGGWPSPYNRAKCWLGAMCAKPKDANVFGDGILRQVARLVKWSVSAQDIPTEMFAIYSLRLGGEGHVCIIPG